MSAPARTRSEAFASRDWALLTAVALMWGSSFWLIDIGLDHLQPTAVAWLRILFGAATLACIPAARHGIRQADWWGVGLLGLVWMVAPFTLFAFAQQSIDSSLAGMINGAAPLFTAVIAAVWSRRLPTGKLLTGLFIGFAGVLAINWPQGQGAAGTGLGVGLVLSATLLYGVAFNLAVPLEERNGALPVIWRAQLVSVVVAAPAGLVGAAGSSFAWPSLLALVALGVFSTGLAFAAFTTLVGRVGAARGSITVYFIPVIAILLGVVLLDETVAVIAIGGTALVLVGAYLTSRSTRGEPTAGDESHRPTA